jgi:hypothetical protein
MLFHFWSRLRSHIHTYKHSGKRLEKIPVSSSYAINIVPALVTSPFPTRCPLCDKQCALTMLRCKHGVAFVRFLQTSQGGTRHA